MINKKHKIYKLKNKKKIKFTIITVVLNAEKFLEKTILSLKSQNSKNYEFIIVYTPSKDKTWNLIYKYKKFIDKIIINYEIGVYPAMNVGIKYAKGEYINFLNAGDYFYNTKTLNDIIKFANINMDVIYGDSQVLYKNYKKKLPALPINQIYNGMIFSHQSCYIKTQILKKNYFNLKYMYASDYDQILRLFNKNLNFVKLNKILSISKPDGIADKNRFKTIKENLLIVFRQNKKKIVFSIIIFVKKFIYFAFLKLLILILSRKQYEKIKNIKDAT